MTPRRVHRRASAIMWSAIALSGLVLAALLALGWGDNAWGAAAALLLVSCVAVCIWAAVSSEQSQRAAKREAEHLAELRRAAGRPTSTGDGNTQ
jgi:hypothetical protein